MNKKKTFKYKIQRKIYFNIKKDLFKKKNYKFKFIELNLNIPNLFDINLINIINNIIPNKFFNIIINL